MDKNWATNGPTATTDRVKLEDVGRLIPRIMVESKADLVGWNWACNRKKDLQ